MSTPTEPNTSVDVPTERTTLPRIVRWFRASATAILALSILAAVAVVVALVAGWVSTSRVIDSWFGYVGTEEEIDRRSMVETVFALVFVVWGMAAVTVAFRSRLPRSRVVFYGLLTLVVPFAAIGVLPNATSKVASELRERRADAWYEALEPRSREWVASISALPPEAVDVLADDLEILFNFVMLPPYLEWSLETGPDNSETLYITNTSGQRTAWASTGIVKDVSSSRSDEEGFVPTMSTETATTLRTVIAALPVYDEDPEVLDAAADSMADLWAELIGVSDEYPSVTVTVDGTTVTAKTGPTRIVREFPDLSPTTVHHLAASLGLVDPA